MTYFMGHVQFAFPDLRSLTLLSELSVLGREGCRECLVLVNIMHLIPFELGCVNGGGELYCSHAVTPA